MVRKLLLAVLVITLLIELGISGGIFFAKDLVSKQFGVPVNADTEFLSYIVGWLCLFVSLIVILAIYYLYKGDNTYAMLCYIMGYFWIAIGVAIYVHFQKTDNLAIDTLKGILIVGLTMVNQRMTPVVAKRR